MNFVITTKDYHNNFKFECDNIGKFKFYHDQNWTREGFVFSKGNHANWCRLDFSDNKVVIEHNSQRKFPLWIDEDSCSNIDGKGEYLPADAKVMYDNEWHITYDTLWNQDEKTLQEDKAFMLVRDILIDNVTKFVDSNKLPLVAPDSDGLDSLLTRSVFDHLGVTYEFFQIKNKQTKLQKFLTNKFYGFNQIQEFDQPTCLLSGFDGDAYLLRSPFYNQMLISQDLVEVYDNTSECYTKYYFDQVWRNKCMTTEKESKNKVKQWIYNNIEVWHLNHTYIFSPFKDARLLDLLDCDEELIIEQQLHGNLSRKLIEYFNPSLLSKIGREKNIVQPDWFDL